jgi:hypothetical protein
MRIGILTQPLRGNYGGVLQNWALQQVLRKLGHEPVTIDVLPYPDCYLFILSTLKSLILWFISSRRRKFWRWSEGRNPLFEDFVNRQIVKTPVCRYYSMRIVKMERLDALVVGSDQTWRPKYNWGRLLPDMFLRFASKFNGKKVAYAASFGVDKWEFTDRQTSICASLAKRFDAISVREMSGVKLCERYLGVDAAVTLDPTLLVEKEAYAKLCERIPSSKEQFIAAYVLDISKEVDEIIMEESERRGLPVRRYSADLRAQLTVEGWIAIFRDASFVVTDSFHGTVFSIIFEKPFRLVANEKRGGARFTDLLERYHSGRLEEWREKSIDFLQGMLGN